MQKNVNDTKLWNSSVSGVFVWKEVEMDRKSRENPTKSKRKKKEEEESISMCCNLITQL